MTVTFSPGPISKSNKELCDEARAKGHRYFQRIAEGDRNAGFQNGDVYILKHQGDEFLINMRAPLSTLDWGSIRDSFIPFYGTVTITE